MLQINDRVEIIDKKSEFYGVKGTVVRIKDAMIWCIWDDYPESESWMPENKLKKISSNDWDE